MPKIIKKLFQHELISGSTYFFIGSMVSNIFAFLFNFFVVRKLSTIDYGIYASLLSLVTLITILPQSFSTTIIQFATEYFSKNELDKVRKLYRQTSLFLAVFGIIILVGLLILAPFISAFLHVTNMWFIVSVGVLILFTFLGVVNSCYLQSLLAFGFLSLTQALGAIAKLAGGIALLVLGFGVLGALGGVFLAAAVPFLISFIRLQFVLKSPKENTVVPLWGMVTYALPAMITFIALSSFISTDVILVKHFLPSSDAGLYAGLSLVGKVIFYFTGIIPAVMFPILIRRYTKGHSVHNTFYLGLLLVGAPSLFITLFYFLFPSFVVTLFLGGKHYLQTTSSLGFMALFMTFYSVISVMVNFFLSLKQTKVVFPVVMMAVLQIVLISLFHHSIPQIIFVSLMASGGLIALLLLYYLYHHTIAKTYMPNLSVPQEI